MTALLSYAAQQNIGIALMMVVLAGTVVLIIYIKTR